MLDLVVTLIDGLSRCHTQATWLATANRLIAPRRVRITGDRVVLSDPEPTLERVLEASFRHVRIARRVGDVSRHAHQKLRELQTAKAASEIVAESKPMRQMLEMLPRIAAHDVSVLVLGESGVGKELVARTLHRLSPRARLPFITVNCGALPAGLVEGLLFGHERGAFTDATRRAMGFFEKANHGTLFLDEIGELPRASQAKVLRAVEHGEIARVGGDTIHVDVRIIAATNRDLEHSDFRRDLFYRLSTCIVRIPPLRERPEDIPRLARALVVRHGGQAQVLSRRSLARLRRHTWPGNVRELENVISRALVLHEGGPLEIEIDDVPSGKTETWKRATKRILEDALRASGGHIYGPDGAAAKLGLRPTTLQSKLKKAGVR